MYYCIVLKFGQVMLLKYALFAAEMLFFVATMFAYICRYPRGFPVGLENPTGLGDGQKISPAHGDGDGDGFAIFLWGWVWAGKTRWISSPLPS